MVLGLALTARADSAASSVQIYASVDDNGAADVNMTVRLRIEQAVESLYFPLPLNAEKVKLNDRDVNATRDAGALQVSLGKDIAGYVGEHVLNFKFTIPDVVHMVFDEKAKENKLTLELPLLSGFEYPVQSVSLTVMVPEDIQGRPIFKSTYYQDSIDTLLDYTVSSNMITGIITQQLKDHETLSLTMTVPPSMFDGVSTYVRVGNPELVPMLILAGVALIYWLLFLRGMPLLRERRTSPPDGSTAGEMGTRLTMSGGDLTGMILSWAQMGYLLIRLDDRGRVWLHKRMNMGNERQLFEIKTFRALFAKSPVVDVSTRRYAALACRVSEFKQGKKTLMHPKCGNPLIFRLLGCGVQLLCGWCYAMNFTGIIAFQVILALFLSALGAVSGWLIQSGMYQLHLRFRSLLWAALGAAVGWVLLGVWAGPWAIGLGSTLGQMLFGLMAAYGGRRSPLGRQNAVEVLGFRHYLRKVSREDLKRIQKNDPEYFYNILPHAIALGVEQSFARQFGKQAMPQCPYFHCGVKQRMTAAEWVQFFREAVSVMDEGPRRMKLEKFAILRLR